MRNATDESHIDDLPSELESAQSKLVYLYLEATDGATATELHRALGLRKLAILSVVQSLSSQGLIEETDGGYATTAETAEPIPA